MGDQQRTASQRRGSDHGGPSSTGHADPYQTIKPWEPHAGKPRHDRPSLKCESLASLCGLMRAPSLRSAVLTAVQFIASLSIFLGLFLPAYLVGFLVTWLGLLLCDHTSEHMSWPWWPWDNIHGINGTLGGNNPKWPRITDGKHRTFKYRWVWVTWRNPVSNFSRLIGVKTPSKWAWQHDYSVPYGNGREFWFRFGWKLSDPKNGKSPFLFRISPWHDASQGHPGQAGHASSRQNGA